MLVRLQNLFIKTRVERLHPPDAVQSNAAPANRHDRQPESMVSKFPRISRRLHDGLPLLSLLRKNVSWIAKYFPGPGSR